MEYARPSARGDLKRPALMFSRRSVKRARDGSLNEVVRKHVQELRRLWANIVVSVLTRTSTPQGGRYRVAEQVPAGTSL